MANLPGVYTAKKKNGDIYYRASFTFKSKHISLGSFDTETEANKAYQEALALSSDNSISISSYSKDNALSFTKWVVIINFRDNGIYIKTPVYLKNKLFSYYISPDDVYIFDAEDLFFYSTHTIMKRGGHLFVADFGMQINIASRYGIKSYAVENRDYYFLNGDNHDYRYSNLIIVNKYRGVQVQNQGSDSEYYLTQILINGNYIVGRYNSEIKAAIAYNKAVDILTAKGINKQFEKNYIEGLSSNDYLSIYNSLKISNQIQRFE